MKLVEIGKSGSRGACNTMLIITSPENSRSSLDHYKDISARLAHAEGLTDSTAHLLANEGRWWCGSMVACTRPKVLGASQLIETRKYQLLSRTPILRPCASSRTTSSSW